MGIENVTLIKMRSHYDVERERTIGGVFRGPPQVKWMEAKGKTTHLGDHYHEYWEVYSIIEGEAIVTLEDIKTKQRKNFTLNRKSGSLLIPAEVAHAWT